MAGADAVGGNARGEVVDVVILHQVAHRSIKVIYNPIFRQSEASNSSNLSAESSPALSHARHSQLDRLFSHPEQFLFAANDPEIHLNAVTAGRSDERLPRYQRWPT